MLLNKITSFSFSKILLSSIKKKINLWKDLRFRNLLENAVVLLFSSCSVAQCPRTLSECQETGSNPHSELVDLTQEPLLGEFSNEAISTWSMNSVPSHGTAAVLCSWDCSSISRRGWFHRLWVRARAWGLPQRVVVQLNVIKDITGKRPVQTNYLLQCWFLPWDAGFVVSKLFSQVRECV